MEREVGDRYKITEKIGSGGMADVYKAYDTTLDRVVAVKVLHSQFAQEENFVSRFRREAQAAANLNHPRIVNVYDWGKENHTYYIVMEYLEGKNLKEIIDERGVLPPHEAIKIGKQVCEALEIAHEQEVIHRDIKPHNIIVDPQGGVKVTDFGIARAGSASTMAMTQPGSILGTAQYISPEQAQGLIANASSDLYSLGVVLYEMLTGELPFEGENPVAVALKQVHAQPRAPREINPSIPRSLENVVLKALAKNPDQRYRSAQELKDDLDRVSEGMPVRRKMAATDKTVAIPRPVKTRRRRFPFIVLTLAFLAILALGYLGFRFLFATTIVPRVEGKPVFEATQMLKERGLKMKVTQRISSETVKKEYIIGQDPPAGERIKKGSPVEVVVSRGSAMVKVPKVVGKSIERATYLLAQADLRVGSIEKVSSNSVPRDEVIRQDPRGNQRVKKSSRVNLVVSKGVAVVVVPNVVGKTAEDARDLLVQRGLKVSQVEESSEAAEAGSVIRQSPEAGSQVKKGSTVTLAVSTGSRLVVVPSVVGKTQAQATDIIKNAGLEVEVKPWPSSPEEFGKVVSQEPPDGTKTDPGSTVTIWIGQAP